MTTKYMKHLRLTEREREKHFSILDVYKRQFRICDVVSIHSTLIPENYHSIDKALLSTMKAGALLVNTSRGAILDEAALAEVLAEGKIKAALDVFETEPLPLDSPLRKLSNVLLIPHMGGPTIDRRMAVTRYVIDDIEHFLKGEPLLGEVDREYASPVSYTHLDVYKRQVYILS